MSDAGTLLSELDTARPSDGDLVDSILSDLNQSESGGSRGPQRGSIIASPSNQSMHPNAADPAVATAHLIGHDHPTEADFQRMMSAQGPLPFNAMTPQMQQQVQQEQEHTEKYKAPEKNWQGQWVDELKQPILVAILVFVITLPAVHLLVSHYAPTLLGPGGNFTTMGNLARALVSGGLYWVLQRVIAPLLSI